MATFEKNKSYKYNEIEAFANNNDFEMNDNNIFEIGKGLIFLEHSCKDEIFTFILTGYSSEAIYECIYAD